MTQLFSRSGSVAVNVALAAALFALPLAAAVAGWAMYNSPWRTRETHAIRQPVPFSHRHHVSGLGIDCRYCHTSVEKSAYAGIPPVHTCMTCHSQIWRDAPMLAPVRDSYTSGVPLQWVRVYDLPQYVFFNHAAHVNNGIGCSSCHGRVDRMPLTRKAVSLEMRWCLSCHENPRPYLRPPDRIFDMTWTAPPNQASISADLVRQYRLETKHLMDCVTCHR